MPRKPKPTPTAPSEPETPKANAVSGKVLAERYSFLAKARLAAERVGKRWGTLTSADLAAVDAEYVKLGGRVN